MAKSGALAQNPHDAFTSHRLLSQAPTEADAGPLLDPIWFLSFLRWPFEQSGKRYVLGVKYL